jgi:hypothetical protein
LILESNERGEEEVKDESIRSEVKKIKKKVETLEKETVEIPDKSRSAYKLIVCLI